MAPPTLLTLPTEIRALIYSYASQSPAIVLRNPHATRCQSRCQTCRQAGKFDLDSTEGATLPRCLAACCEAAIDFDQYYYDLPAIAVRSRTPWDRTQFYSLLHVCRQLRREFWPWYMPRVQVFFMLPELTTDAYYGVRRFIAVPNHVCSAEEGYGDVYFNDNRRRSFEESDAE